jgi:predicted RNA-binding Zn ribbon-like protein
MIANHVCLDFINTQIIQGGQLVELVENFGDLVWWLAAARLLETAQAEALIERWGCTSEGQAAVEQALALRSLLRQMVEELVAGKPAPLAAVEAINRRLRYRVRYSQLIQTQDKFTMRSYLEFDEAIQTLGPLAEAGCDLLSQADLSLIKKCENPACILYFYDTSKNRARRWCSMRMCGNRMKVAAYYRRRRPRPG